MIEAAQQTVAHVDSLGIFVSKMREAAPFGAIPWEERVWDLTDVLPRAGKRLHMTGRQRLWFIEHRLKGSKSIAAFATEFADFSKALLCARHLRGAQVPNAHMVTLRALRYVYAALKDTGTVDPRKMRNTHFLDAENAVLGREKVSSAYRIGQRLEEIARYADHHHICESKLEYRSSIPKSSVEAIATKMAPHETMHALADISATISLSESNSDLILIRSIDILAATGFRCGEGLTLPEKPLVRKGDDLYLRFWPEKGGELRLKLIAGVHRELVERAVADLTSACEAARNVAKWWDQHGTPPLPMDLSEQLTSAVIEELGLSFNGAAWLRTHRVPTSLIARDRTNGITSFWKSDLIRALTEKHDARPLVKTGSGQVQSLGDSLIVMFCHENHSKKSTNRFVPVPVTQQMLADFLGSPEGRGNAGIFSRRDIRESHGIHLRLTSHQFRHWLHTIAKRGGLSDVELARWMGRKRIADNRAYDHRTMEERVEEARELIRSGRIHGPIAEAYKSLPPVDAEAFLAAQVNAVLNTPFGICAHDYAQGPCERHFNCAGCRELLRRKGDQGERAALGKWLKETQTSLDTARAEKADGTLGAGNWVKYNERLEIDLITMLAVDDDVTAQDGDLVRVWPVGHRAEVNVD